MASRMTRHGSYRSMSVLCNQTPAATLPSAGARVIPGLQTAPRGDSSPYPYPPHPGCFLQHERLRADSAVQVPPSAQGIPKNTFGGALAFLRHTQTKQGRLVPCSAPFFVASTTRAS